MKEKTSTFHSRRRLLFGLASLGASLPVNSYGLTEPKHQSESRLLTAIVDTIVPADHTPGAVDAQIDKMLRKNMQKQKSISEQMTRLSIVVGKIALTKYRRVFYELDVDQRESILSGLLTRSAPHIARADLLSMRQFVLTQFYRSQEGRKSINYVLPSHYPAYN